MQKPANIGLLTREYITESEHVSLERNPNYVEQWSTL